MNDQMIKYLKAGLRVDIYEPDDKKRKQYHEWCEENNYHHISYTDKTKDYDTITKYYCPCCRERVTDVVTEHCCDDYSCGDYTVRCSKCIASEKCHYNYTDGCVVWHQDAYDNEDFKRPIEYSIHNTISIAKTLKTLKPIFKLRKIKRIKRFINKKNKKLNS